MFDKMPKQYYLQEIWASMMDRQGLWSSPGYRENAYCFSEGCLASSPSMENRCACAAHLGYRDQEMQNSLYELDFIVVDREEKRNKLKVVITEVKNPDGWCCLAQAIQIGLSKLLPWIIHK